MEPLQAGRGATSYDVARLAQVSQSTVSRAFTDGASISEDLRRRVLKAAQTLGYQPNAIARSLITRRSNLVGLLIGASTNLYYPEVLFELSLRISERGSRVLLFALNAESDIDTVLEQVWRYRVDGVIAAARLNGDQVADFKTRGVPLVFYNRVLPEGAVSSVTVDHAEGERRLVDRLVAAGHRRFGIVGGPEDSAVSVERMRSAMDRLRHHGIEVLGTARGDYSYQSGADAFDALRRDLDTPPDAVICANDTMAIGVMDCARIRHGLMVPGNLSVVGFDGAGASRWMSYELTTIRQPVRRMAEAAISMLLERVETPDLEAETRMFSGELIEGRSARLT
ncbi:MAG TPA: LacI family DNA-binding transcriptional regulator [Azospirillaceae bacterium]|nr:LacI family DNA-binding transcriptional regulator [Azospirillaceae bacterium]